MNEFEDFIPQEVLPNIKIEKADVNFQSDYYVPVNISFVESPGNFFIQLQDNAEHMKFFLKNMTMHYENTLDPPLKVQDLPVHSTWAVRFEKKFLRASILVKEPTSFRKKNPEIPSFRMFFVDFGFTESISLQDIFILDEVFVYEPAFAFQCKLSKVYPKVKFRTQPWSDEAVDFFKQFCNESNNILNCLLVEKNPLNYGIVLENYANKVLNEELVLKDLAESEEWKRLNRLMTEGASNNTAVDSAISNPVQSENSNVSVNPQFKKKNGSISTVQDSSASQSKKESSKLSTTEENCGSQSTEENLSQHTKTEFDRLNTVEESSEPIPRQENSRLQSKQELNAQFNEETDKFSPISDVSRPQSNISRSSQGTKSADISDQGGRKSESRLNSSRTKSILTPSPRPLSHTSRSNESRVHIETNRAQNKETKALFFINTQLTPNSVEKQFRNQAALLNRSHNEKSFKNSEENHNFNSKNLLKNSETPRQNIGENMLRNSEPQFDKQETRLAKDKPFQSNERNVSTNKPFQSNERNVSTNKPFQSNERNVSTDKALNRNPDGRDTELIEDWNPMHDEFYKTGYERMVNDEKAEHIFGAVDYESDDRAICHQFAAQQRCCRGAACRFKHVNLRQDGLPCVSVPTYSELEENITYPKKGMWFPVLVASFNSISKFSIHVAYPNKSGNDEKLGYSDDFADLQRELREFIQLANYNSLALPSLGELLIAVMPSGCLKGVHRIRVVNVVKAGMDCKVKADFFDLGVEDWVWEKNLRAFDSSFLSYAPQALNCYLSHVEPLPVVDSVTAWSEEAVELFLDYTKKGPLIAVVADVDEDLGKIGVYLLAPKNEHKSNLNNLLVSKKLAIKTDN